MNDRPSAASIATPRSARDAFLQACRLDVEVRKPGNVSVASPGHGMVATQFIDSAAAAAPALFATGASVGERIEGAVRASVCAAGCNTNLGIVLLVAPIAAALQRLGGDDIGTVTADELRDALRRELQRLSVADAAGAYRGIALAHPGGLGDADSADVNAGPPSMTLLQAMTLAAHRDRIARQYACGFAELFEVGLPAWRRAVDTTGNPKDAMLDAFIAWLATAPDSHIVRKHGAAAADTVMSEAMHWHSAGPRRTSTSPLDDGALAEWDDRLKARGLNPGTSADLSVMTAFVGLLTAA